MTTWKMVKREHRVIDLQRPMVDDKMLYQVLCYCGRKSTIGSRASAQTDQKNHRISVRWPTESTTS